MWIFVDDVKRGAGYVKAYPVEQPDGDYDTDHLRLWIDSGLRAAHSDGLICDVLEDAIYEYATGAEQPLRYGCISVNVDYSKGSDHTIAIDHVGTCLKALRAHLTG